MTFSRRLEEQDGVTVTTGAGALDRALHALGVRRLALVTPYAQAITDQVQRFLEESGYEVIKALSLQVPTPLEIAAVPAARLREALTDLNRAGPQAIVQSGTNLPMAHLAGEAELRLGTPVLSINVAMFWDALRRLNIPDRLDGFGRLLAEH